jgi:hypothetical protein
MKKKENFKNKSLHVPQPWHTEQATTLLSFFQVRWNRTERAEYIRHHFMKPVMTHSDSSYIIWNIFVKHWWLACGPQAKESVEVQKNYSLKYEPPFPLVCGTQNKRRHF